MLKRILPAAGLLLGAHNALAAPTLTTLASIPNASGYVIGAPIVHGKVIYGLASNASTKYGIVYSVKPGVAGFKTVMKIPGGSSGSFPYGALAADTAGNLYGATFGGGNAGTGYTCSNYTSLIGGCGVIFELVKKKTVFTYTPIYKFTTGTDGVGPAGNLLLDSAGNLYGVTQFGGNCAATYPFEGSCGTVFKLTKSGTGFTKSTLYTFKGGTDGAIPSGQLTMDTAGNLYGTTLAGGIADCNWENSIPTAIAFPADGSCGTVFKLTRNGTSYTETVLHSFTDGADGSLPTGGVTLDANGNIFGTTFSGGTQTYDCEQIGYSGCGTVFELASGSYAKSTLWTFTGADGNGPGPLLISSTTGALFGENAFNTAMSSCPTTFDCGTVFTLKNTAGNWSESALHSFTGGTDNGVPIYGLAVNSTGVLFGVTQAGTSTVFEMTGSGY